MLIYFSCVAAQNLSAVVEDCCAYLTLSFSSKYASNSICFAVINTTLAAARSQPHIKRGGLTNWRALW